MRLIESKIKVALVLVFTLSAGAVLAGGSMLNTAGVVLAGESTLSTANGMSAAVKMATTVARGSTLNSASAAEDAENLVPEGGWPSWVEGKWEGRIDKYIKDGGRTYWTTGSYSFTLPSSERTSEKYTFDDGQVVEFVNKGWQITEQSDCHIVATCWYAVDSGDVKYDATYTFRSTSCSCGDGKSSFKAIMRDGENTVEGEELTYEGVVKPPTIEYEVQNNHDGTCALNAIYASDSLEEFELPSVINDLVVTRINKGKYPSLYNTTSLTIPDSVIEVEEAAFEECPKLVSATIPDCIAQIGMRTIFSNSVDLASVTISEGATSIGKQSFLNFEKLASITIPNSVTNIGEGAFNKCISLTTLKLPDNLTILGGWAFFYCVNLTSITIPDGVGHINKLTFGGCWNLTSITIPKSVTSIDESAFGNENLGLIANLTTVKVDKGYREQVKEMLQKTSLDVSKITFIEIPKPVIEGDSAARVAGDAENGYIVTPSAERTAVEVTIPEGVDAAKVTVKVSPDVKTITPNGAAVRILRGTLDITDYLSIPTADAAGVIDLSAAKVKDEIVRETLSLEKGAEITLSPKEPVLKTAATRKGLIYQLYEGTSLNGLKAGDSKTGDGEAWTPKIKVKGGTSGFYTIRVTK